MSIAGRRIRTRRRTTRSCRTPSRIAGRSSASGSSPTWPRCRSGWQTKGGFGFRTAVRSRTSAASTARPETTTRSSSAGTASPSRSSATHTCSSSARGPAASASSTRAASACRWTAISARPGQSSTTTGASSPGGWHMTSRASWRLCARSERRGRTEARAVSRTRSSSADPVYKSFTCSSGKSGSIPVMPRLSQVLAPRGREFFDLFEEQAGNIARATDLLDQMLRDYPERRDLAREILIGEQEGDRITHDVIHALNNTFVTPIDREDILQLVSSLDDVVDYVEEVADYLGLYKIDAPMEQSQRLARVLAQAGRQIAEAMPRLRNFDDMSHYTVEVDRLENEGDRIGREAVAALFEEGVDPLVVIRWKDIYERLESGIDATEKVAYILEGIATKNA